MAGLVRRAPAGAIVAAERCPLSTGEPRLVGGGAAGAMVARTHAPRSHSLGGAVMRVEVTVDISAPPEVVWAVLSDVESWPTCTASITSVRPLSPDPLQVGSRVRVKQPRLPATVWTVSDLVEGERLTWTSTSPGVDHPRVPPRRPDRPRVTGDPVHRPGRCPRAVGGTPLRRPHASLRGDGGRRPQAAVRELRTADAAVSSGGGTLDPSSPASRLAKPLSERPAGVHPDRVPKSPRQ